MIFLPNSIHFGVISVRRIISFRYESLFPCLLYRIVKNNIEQNAITGAILFNRVLEIVNVQGICESFQLDKVCAAGKHVGDVKRGYHRRTVYVHGINEKST